MSKKISSRPLAKPLFLPALLLSISCGAHAAENGSYAPPADMESLDSLMRADDSAYGPESLVQQSQTAKLPDSAGRSVLNGIGKQDTDPSRRVAVENHKLNDQIIHLQKRLATSETARQQNQRQLTRLAEDNARLGADHAALAALQIQAAALQAQLTAAGQTHDQLAASLADARTQLKSANARTQEQQVPLDTPLRQQSYVVGQAMAASLRDRLRSYDDAGLTLDKTRVIVGLTDGVRSRMQMKQGEMDTAWQTFAQTLQKQVALRVKESEALISKKGQGRTPALTTDGITWYLVKKGQPVADNTPQVLALTEAVAESGRVISHIPRLTLTPNDGMPPVVRDALPLLGAGAEVEAYALARTIYGDRPLPEGISPFTLLSYRLQALTPR